MNCRNIAFGVPTMYWPFRSRKNFRFSLLTMPRSITQTRFARPYYRSIASTIGRCLRTRPRNMCSSHRTATSRIPDRTVRAAAVVFPRGFDRVVPNRIVRWRPVRPDRRRFADANRAGCESTRPAPNRCAFFLPNVVHSVAETRPSFGKLGRLGISTTSTFHRRPPETIGLTSPSTRK